MSAQASQLAAHQHQLNRLTALTEELVKVLQSLHTPATSASTPSSTAPPPAVLNAAETPSSVSPRLSFPERFDGDPSKCKGFCLQCSQFLTQQPALYPTEASKIAFVCSLLTGKALELLSGEMTGPLFPLITCSFKDFVTCLITHMREKGPLIVFWV